MHIPHIIHFRPQPQTDYVIDEEIINDTVLSPDSHDSGINVEVQYSRPMQSDDSSLVKPLPFGWEKHEGMHVFLTYFKSILSFCVISH